MNTVRYKKMIRTNKTVYVIIVLLVVTMTAGCTVVESIGNAVGSTQESIADLNKNSGACDRPEWKNTPFLICPETTIPPTGNES